MVGGPLIILAPVYIKKNHTKNTKNKSLIFQDVIRLTQFILGFIKL